MKFPPLSFIVLDTETTGFVPRVHHVIEYAAMRFEGGKEIETYERLFAVNGEIPPHVQTLTRIKPEMLAGKPTFEESRDEIAAMLDKADLLVGQNLAFDIGMIKGEGIDLTDRPWVDTSMLASLVFPEFRSFSLQYMSARLKLNHEPAHRALGDVRATAELFALIWERLTELPPDELAFAKDVMGKSTKGYAMLFDALPPSVSKKATWIALRERPDVKKSKGSVLLDPPPVGTVELREETLDPDCLQSVLNAAAHDEAIVRWIAVKNVESALKHVHVPEGVTVVHPPQVLLNPEAADALGRQTAFSVDEAFLRLKLAWFDPKTRNDFAIHGGEKDAWNGRLACAATSKPYIEQFAKKSRALLLDHRQLLSILADPAHAARTAMTENAHIVIDDASMLEDTATKAYGAYLGLDDLRAASGSDAELKRFVDLFALFAEKIRGGEDRYFLTPADLRRSEAATLRELCVALLAKATLPAKTIEQLREAEKLLDENLPAAQLAWIERRLDGALMLQSAPKHVDELLKKNLYDTFATTLLAPKGTNGKLPEIVPANAPVRTDAGDAFVRGELDLAFTPERSLNAFLENPPDGKTIVLVGSKRVIEGAFVQHTEALEKKGITMICQGLSGGQGRMESEFIAAQAPALLLVTPFFYEGLDFPEGTADTLVLDTVPFDHPNHPVIGHRKNAHKSGFNDYCLPRTEYRLFRLMRTFCRHKTKKATMLVFDKRLFEKEYGARLRRYMSACATSSSPVTEAPTPSTSAKKPTRPKEKADGQMQLPL